MRSWRALELVVILKAAEMLQKIGLVDLVLVDATNATLAGIPCVNRELPLFPNGVKEHVNRDDGAHELDPQSFQASRLFVRTPPTV